MQADLRSAFAGTIGADVKMGFMRGGALTGRGCAATEIPPAGMIVGAPAPCRMYTGVPFESPFC